MQVVIMWLQLKIPFPIVFEVHRAACKCTDYSDMIKVQSIVRRKRNWQLSYMLLPVSCQCESDCQVRVQDTLE